MEVKVYLPSTSFTPTPVVVSFPPDTTAKEVVQDLSKKFQIQGEGEERTLVITPTYTSAGGVVDTRSCIKSINLGGEERLELWKAPFMINILLFSDYTSPDPVKNKKEIVFDYGTPLSYNIPLLRRIFNLDEEFVFQYVHSMDDKNMKRLDSKLSLIDQTFEGTYLLICSPLKLLKQKDGILRCTETFKEGYIVKQTRKGNKQTAKRRRWAIQKDQFLFYFKNKGDSSAAGVIALEYYSVSMVQIKQQNSLHLKRAIGRFDDGNADLCMLYADDGEDLVKWKEVLQRKCLGSDHVFGVTLQEMANRPTTKSYIPDIVITLTDYLTKRGLTDEGILRISGGTAMIQFYKDQFDRGIDVDLAGVQDAHVVSSLLKMYFRELPDPAIPFNVYDDILEVMNMRGPQKTNDVTSYLLDIIAKLPDAHFYTVRHMCKFLYEVQKQAATNLMSLPALGTVMGPNLLRPPDNRIGSFVQDSLIISEFIQILIKNHDQLRKSDNSLKTLPRPAPLRTDDPKTPVSAPSASESAPAAPARPKRPPKTNKARASIFEFKGALLLDPIPKQHVANPPRAAPMLSFIVPNNSNPPVALDTQPALQKSSSKQHLTSKKNSHANIVSPRQQDVTVAGTKQENELLKTELAKVEEKLKENGKVESSVEVGKVDNSQEVAKAQNATKPESTSAKPEPPKIENKPNKGSSLSWNKPTSARPRLSTIATGQIPGLRHVTSATNIADIITTIPVFDIDTVLLYLAKLDEIKYKKEKISLDSIKGGIKGDYAKEKELVRQIYCNQVAYILEVLENQKAKAPSASWASLFYLRAQKCEDVLPTCKVVHYQHIIKNYLRIVRKKESKEGQQPITAARIKLADSLLDFLQTHATDPDSCLIGLQCSDESIKSVMRHVDPSSTDPSNPLNVSYQQLCSNIVEWGVGEDDGWMKEQIQKLCTTFRGVDKMERGDVAVVAHGTEDGMKSMIFARYTGAKKNNNTYLEFYINADESTTEWIFRREVYPIPANMKEAIKQKVHLSKVVLDPAHSFFKILKENMKLQVDEFLVKSGLDQAIIKKVRDGVIELKDLPAVRDALTIVQTFEDNPPEHFYKEMAFYAKALVSIHTRKLATVPTFTFFMPRSGTASAMRNFANTPLAPSLVRTSLGLFQSAYDGLAVSVKELMFGSKKRKMSDWWLERIELSVQHFLVKRRFDFNAVPENYSIDPPQNIKAVKENLAILEEVLHADTSSTMNPTPLIEAVCAEIYPVIDAFIKDSRIVICDALKLDINFEDSTFKIEVAEEAFKATKENYAQQTAEQLKNLIGDLKYLEEMKRLEKTKDGEKMAHIVPIGGLVMNQLVRQWNEQKTVVELWGHLDRVPTPEPPSPPLTVMPQTMKTSRSMDSLYLDPATGVVESASKSHTPPTEGSPLASSTSSLAASIAANFFIKSGELQPPSHAHGRESPVTPRDSHSSNKNETAPVHKLSHSDSSHKSSHSDSSHGRTTSDTTEEMQQANVSRQNQHKNRSMQRNNSSIGMSTLRGVRRLLEKDKDPEKEKEKEREKEKQRGLHLHKMVSEQRFEDVQFMLQDPLVAKEVNAQDADGWTPLHCSCHLGNFELCMLLLHQEHIDVLAKNKDGNTALHYAVRHPGSMNIIRELLEKGANANATNTRWETPLHYACMRGHTDIVTFLLEHGADANALNSDGDNSLHYAIYTRSAEIIRLLIKFGANTEVCSKRQGTPLEIATKNNLVEIAAELKKAPKKPARGEA